MNRFVYFILSLLVITLWSSCRNDFEFSPRTGQLEFSKDTVYLDTVFTNIGSSTYNLKVYNNTDDNVLIPNINLGFGESSEYRLNIDGVPGKTFENVELLAQDSMYVFIETTIDINSLPTLNNEFLYTDFIEFGTGTDAQKVELVTLVKDAVFIYPDRDDTTGIIETLTLNIDGEFVDTEIQGRYLRDFELTLTNEKPYVIYGYAAVPPNRTLEIDAGARIHFHADSGIIVTNSASIHVNGGSSIDQEALENEVIFEGDRLEPLFEDVPGQWGTIWLFEGSTDNIFNYATIRNATVGILSDGNDEDITDKLTISNSQIYNSGNFGILGRATSIKGSNLVINNSGQSSFAGTIGGKYNFTHCTIVNFWNNSFRQFPSVLINNFLVDADNNVLVNDLEEANFNNCIIYGNDNPEFLIGKEGETLFNFKFTNCLIRFDNSNNAFNAPEYDFNNIAFYENNIFNEDPDFLDVDNNQLIIGENSAAINQGNSVFALQVPLDILNNDRTSLPDIGAYQHIIFED
ncbi:MAG: hypothetical protein KJN66_03365 [Bacteroidia bacterium]|nr:hypothetical protein [Bacteroidia bacterium]